ncbi:MAG TPA: hypothetical protein VJ302_09040 [Blastocatellia bacterium]|nr:hypothetical protein [Blastocatellia bacterium]
MAKHNDHHDQNNLKPEASGIKARPVLVFLAVLALASAMTFGLIKGLLIGFKKVDEITRPQRATELEAGTQRKLPPEPRLQGAPGADGKPSLLPEKDLEKFNEQLNQRAAQYGWVSKEAGVASIPLSRAKELIVERGLPEAPAELTKQVERAEAMRKRVLNAQPNAGRIIGGQ